MLCYAFRVAPANQKPGTPIVKMLRDAEKRARLSTPAPSSKSPWPSSRGCVRQLAATPPVSISWRSRRGERSASARNPGRGPVSCRVPRFLRSFNGATLFHEAQVLFAAEEIQRVPDSPPDRRLWHVGETADGALWLDGEGRILLADEGAPDPIVAGSRIEAFIDATLAREALVVDRDGEFREVFTEDELSLSVRKKRARQGCVWIPARPPVPAGVGRDRLRGRG